MSLFGWLWGWSYLYGEWLGCTSLLISESLPPSPILHCHCIRLEKNWGQDPLTAIVGGESTATYSWSMCNSFINIRIMNVSSVQRHSKLWWRYLCIRCCLWILMPSNYTQLLVTRDELFQKSSRKHWLPHLAMTQVCSWCRHILYYQY